MEGQPVEKSYNHVAFQVREDNILLFENRVKTLSLEILPGRSRHSSEGKSLYFYDYDNHLFELHSGGLNSRLEYYNSHNIKE